MSRYSAFVPPRLLSMLPVALLAAGTAAANPPLAGPVADQARTVLAERAAAAHPGARVEVTLHPAFDERVRQAPCTPEAFAPPGTRAWGRTLVGLRCPGGWQVRVSAEVAAHADIPVLTRAVAAGTVLREGDWRIDDVDLAARPRGIVTDPARLEGAQASRALRAGEPVPAHALQSAARLGLGDPVRVVMVGSGFTIKVSGKALHAATPGQPTRVQLDSGRTVAGVLRDDREVEIAL